MNSSCFILLNAQAGAFHSSATVEQISELAGEIDLPVEVMAMRSRRQMKTQLKKLVQNKARTIAIAGGDGTVALAVQEIAGSESTLGILPQGTFNNFATALRLPLDLPSAMRVLKEGEPGAVDLGRVKVASRQQRYFTEAAGVGLFADGLALYGKGTNKNFFKGVRAMARVLVAARARCLTLELDGEMHSERVTMCTVANTYRMGQGLSVAPGAKVTDGELDVVIVGDLSLSEIVRYYRAFRTQSHMSLPKVSHQRARRVRISARKRLNVHCDDSFVGLTPAEITVQPSAVNVLLEKI